MPLRLVDLEVLAWLAAYRPWGEAKVDFSRSLLSHHLFGRPPGGKERRIVAEALDRLTATTLTFKGYLKGPRGGLRVENFQSAELVAALDRGNKGRWRAVFAPWLAENLEAGYVTYLDWETLRRLRGLAKRLWIVLEAEDLSPRRLRTRGPAWLALNERTWLMLGMRYTEPAGARSALEGAIRRVESYRSPLRPPASSMGELISPRDLSAAGSSHSATGTSTRLDRARTVRQARWLGVGRN